MLKLSRESERELKKDLLELVNGALESYQKPRKILGLISQTDLLNDLSISYKTLRRWEEAGLKRYIPPIEDTRTVFYKINDILVFLEVKK